VRAAYVCVRVRARARALAYYACSCPKIAVFADACRRTCMSMHLRDSAGSWTIWAAALL